MDWYLASLAHHTNTHTHTHYSYGTTPARSRTIVTILQPVDRYWYEMFRVRIDTSKCDSTVSINVRYKSVFIRVDLIMTAISYESVFMLDICEKKGSSRMYLIVLCVVGVRGLFYVCTQYVQEPGASE